jgi:hypothetical protein
VPYTVHLEQVVFDSLNGAVHFTKARLAKLDVVAYLNQVPVD